MNTINKNNNIILIGFMGVGKGTIARALAKKSDYFAVDTDDLIESLANMKVKKIFEIHGETHFRDLEQQCARWCQHNVKNTIISTGGGFYKQENIKYIGKIVYLKSTFENIIQGLKNAPNSKKKFKKRPLLNNLNEAEDIYNQRVSEYENLADVIIDVSDWNELKAVKNILKEI